MNLKQFENAIPAYKKAIELRKDYVEAEYSLGVAYYELGKADSARIQYEKIKDKNNFMASSLLRKIEKRN
jgi:tetratricopeptide (TPR) repeat protein